MPMSTSPAMSREVATGRRMKGSEIFMRGSAGTLLRRLRSAGSTRAALRRGIAQFHVRAGLQLVLAIDHHLFAEFQAFLDDGFALLGRPDFDRAHVHGLVRLDDEDERSLRSALHDRRL